ncbi:MAG: FMN-binding protein, partial [Candidatus Omnitrophota bacterium]
MKETIRYGFILGLICLLSAGLLAVVNSFTAPKILAQDKEKEEKTLTEVLPEAVKFEPVTSSAGENIYYKAYDKDNKLIGYAFKAAGKGYSSVVETMVGMSLDGNITSVQILSQNETPGLGNRVAEPSFTDQFSGKSISALSEVQAITGATISS